MKELVALSELDMKFISGGFGLFSEISKIFGRQGKPFIGRDVIEIGSGVVATAATVLIPGGAPYAAAVGALVEDQVRRSNDK